MGRLDKIKRELMEESNKRMLNEQEESNTITNKEEWKTKLHQRLWKAIEYVDNERETEAAVKLSNEDVVEVLQNMVNTLDPIENHYDEESGRWYGQ